MKNFKEKSMTYHGIIYVAFSTHFAKIYLNVYLTENVYFNKNVTIK